MKRVFLSIFFVFIYARFCVYYNMHNLGVPEAQDGVGSLLGLVIYRP
jgi:hypothetical protein